MCLKPCGVHIFSERKLRNVITPCRVLQCVQLAGVYSFGKNRNNSLLTVMKPHGSPTITQTWGRRWVAQPSSLHFFHVKSQSSWYLQHLGMECGLWQESSSARSINWSMIRDCYHNPGGWIQKLFCSVLNLDGRGKRGDQPNGQSPTAIVFPSAQSRPNSSLENN